MFVGMNEFNPHIGIVFETDIIGDLEEKVVTTSGLESERHFLPLGKGRKGYSSDYSTRCNTGRYQILPCLLGRLAKGGRQSASSRKPL